MGKKLSKFICFMLGIFILNTTIAHADILTNPKSNSNKIEVEVMINSNGEDFIENIVFDDGTKLSDYDYSIKYVPTPKSYAISNYFNYAAWIKRDGVISLSVDPKSKVRTNSTERNRGWAALSSPTHGFGSHSYWKNTKVMHWQFDCHYSFATNKKYWNLEPHRTASSYLQVVAKGCNP